MLPLLLPYRGIFPSVPESVFLAPGCVVIGEVTLGEDASVWFGSILRGDDHHIRVGARTNIQDACVLHVGRDLPLEIGSRVTIGHGVILHGCTIGSGSLIGIGARILDGATVGEDAMVGAGSLLTPRTSIPGGVLALGSPARVVRPLTQEERNGLREIVDDYVAFARRYRDERAAPET